MSGKIFSPSQTQNYLHCPFHWLLSKRGWIPKTYGKAQVYAIRGTAVSAGLEAFNLGKDTDDIRRTIGEAVDTDWEKNRIDVREYSEFKSVPLERNEVKNQALSLVGTYISNPCFAFRVLHQEYTFKDHGWARADVVGELIPSRKIIPVDYKVKDVPANSFYMHTTKEDFRNSWQLLHYCWAISEEFNVECLDYGIVILWYDKKPKIEYVPFSVRPKRMSLWLESAKSVWADMEAIEQGRKQPFESAHHQTKFGMCEFKRACLDYDRDEGLMLSDYFNIKGK